MALRWIEGFELQALAQRYNVLDRVPGVTTTAASVRTGSTALDINRDGGVIKNFDVQGTWNIGFGVNVTVAGVYDLCELRDSTGTYITLRMNTTTGLISVVRGSTVVGSYSDPTLIKSGVWNYVEWRVVLDDVTGSTQIQLNGLSVLTVTGVDTKNIVGTGADRIFWGINVSVTNSHAYLDDMYVCDGTGTTNNNLLGDVRVATIRPNAVGDITQLAPVGVANNWDCVNDPTFDTTTYVQSGVVGQYDLYQLEDLAAADNPTSIPGIQISVVATKDDTTVRQVAPMLKNGGLEYVGNNLLLTQTTWVMATQCFGVDPTDSTAWTKAKITSLQAGVKVTV